MVIPRRGQEETFPMGAVGEVTGEYKANRHNTVTSGFYGPKILNHKAQPLTLHPLKQASTPSHPRVH